MINSKDEWSTMPVRTLLKMEIEQKAKKVNRSPTNYLETLLIQSLKTGGIKN